MMLEDAIMTNTRFDKVLGINSNMLHMDEYLKNKKTLLKCGENELMAKIKTVKVDRAKPAKK